MTKIWFQGKIGEMEQEVIHMRCWHPMALISLVLSVSVAFGPYATAARLNGEAEALHADAAGQFDRLARPGGAEEAFLIAQAPIDTYNQRIDTERKSAPNKRERPAPTRSVESIVKSLVTKNDRDGIVARFGKTFSPWIVLPIGGAVIGAKWVGKPAFDSGINPILSFLAGVFGFVMGAASGTFATFLLGPVSLVTGGVPTEVGEELFGYD